MAVGLSDKAEGERSAWPGRSLVPTFSNPVSARTGR
jgi:hypothetical protein